MLKNVFAIKDCGSILLKTFDATGFASIDGIDNSTLENKAVFVCTLKDNGYILSEKAMLQLFGNGTKNRDLKEVMDAVKSIKGSDVSHNVIMSEFPKVTFKCDFNKVFGSLYNYLTGEGLRSDYALMPLNRGIAEKFEVLEIVESVDDEIVKLISTKIPLKLDHEQLIAHIYNTDDDLLKGVNHQDIKLKEVLARHVAYEFNKNNGGVARSSTDILRAVALISGEENAKLDEKFKIKPLSNSLRRVIIHDLNEVITLDDVTGHKEMFKHLFKALHVHDKKYSQFNDKVSKVAKELQEVNNPRTDKTFLHSLVAYGLNGVSDSLFEEVVTKNPSFFARNLDALLRKNENKTKDILSILEKLAPKINSKILLQLIGHFSNRNTDLSVRSFNLKGLSGGVKVVNDKPLKAMDSNLLELLEASLMKALKDNYSKGDNVIEHAYIDESLFKINIPSNMSANDSAKSVSRGSRLDIEFNDILRLFVHWRSHDDLDLSALFLTESKQIVGRCAFYDRQSDFCTHSGDVRSAPNGGSEFIDIYMKDVPKDARYLVMHINSYSGRSCDQIDDLFAGFMHRGKDDNGYIYEPSTVEDKFTLTGNVQSITPFYIDLKTKELVWVDDKGALGQHNTAENIVVLDRLLTIVDKKKITIGDLLAMHSKNVYNKEQYESLTDEEKSKVKVFNKQFAFDIKEINANYI